MSAYLLPCTCGSDIRVTTAQAGGSATCPSCGREVAVPKLRDLAALVKAGAAPTGAAGVQRRPWTAFHTMLLAGTLIAAACALSSRSFVPPEVVEIDPDRIRESVLRAPTDEVLSTLRTQLVLSGIDRPPTAIEAKAKARSDFYYRLRDGLLLGSAAGAAAAAIGAIGLLLRGRGGAGRGA